MTIIHNLSWLPEECEWFYREVVNHREAYSRATGCVNAVKTSTHSILRRTLKIIILIPITNIIITTIIIISFFFWSSFVKQRDRRTEALLILGSKEAEWDKDLNSYVLNYHGRASQVDHEYDGRGASYFDSLSRQGVSDIILNMIIMVMVVLTKQAWLVMWWCWWPCWWQCTVIMAGFNGKDSFAKKRHFLMRLLKSSNIRHLLFLKEKISIWDMAYTLQLISVLKWGFSEEFPTLPPFEPQPCPDATWQDRHKYLQHGLQVN